MTDSGPACSRIDATMPDRGYRALPIPSHPKVADVEADFGLKGNRETIFLSSLKGHYFYNYDSDPQSMDEAAIAYLFRQIVASAEKLV